jgi:hypothetical protein
VVSTINGDSNVPFYKELGNQGLKATDVPVVAFSVGEEELRGVDTKPLVGHLAAWNYFMSIKNPANDEFIKKWSAYAKAKKHRRPQGQAADQRPDGSHLHRHPHVEAGGREGQVHRHRQGDRGDGRPDLQGAGRLHLEMDEKNHHLHKPVFIGEIKADGQFNVVWKTPGPVKASRGARTSPATTRRRTRLAWGERLGVMFTGISLGSILLLAALGLAITYGLMGVINMAHGELMMIGAYATYVVQNLFRHLPGAFDWYLCCGAGVAFLAAALVGAVLERSVIRWLYGRPLETLLATWGISLMLIQGVRTIFGAQNVQVENPAWMSGGVEC